MKTLRHAVALVTTLVSLAAVACSGQGGSSSTDIEQEPTASAHTFKVRAEVMRLPADGSPEIYLHHEAIDGMVDPRGKAMPMDSMTMPFALAKQSLAEGISPGDKVTMTLVIDWPAPVPVLVTALEPLPPDTQLDFSTKPDKGDEDDAEPDVGGTRPPT